MKKEYRKITKTIKNPHYDGRTKYGMSSVEEFTAGQFIAVRTTLEESINGVTWTRVEGDLISPSVTLPINDLPPLEDWTELGDPPEYDKYRASFGNCDAWLIGRLFETGKISYDLVAQVIEEDEESS